MSKNLKRTRSFGETGAPVDAARTPAWVGLDLFSDLTPTELEALSGVLVTVRFAPGEIVVREGEPGEALYLIERGRVRVWTADGRFDRELSAPETIGEMAIITHEARSATVAAVDQVKAFRLSRARLDQVVQSHPQIASILTRLVGARLREIDGIRVVGKYRIVGPLGSGGMSDVFAAEHPVLQRPVALKMLNHALVYHPSFAQKFDREARLVARLDHPNIVRVYDFEEAYGTRFIVMERLDGELLEDAIAGGTQFTWPAVRRLLVEMCQALDHAHRRGLVHRDVKPLNIFLTRSGAAKLFDFGIAIAADASVCKGADRLGTPYYMAPEQIRGEPLDARTDLYALGMTAYEAITGRVPFDAPDLESLVRRHLYEPMPDPRRYRPDTPSDLVAFIQRACAKDPADRFGDAQQAVAFLQGKRPDSPTLREQLTVSFPGDLEKQVRAEIQRFQDRLARLGADLKAE
ncbi:MAG: protein kinase [Myxococcales bacterium]|nr:protein kinase [Myxococcales bacterium]